MRKSLVVSIILAGLMMFGFFGSVGGQKQIGGDEPPSSAGMGQILYVTNFEIDTDSVAQDNRILKRPGIMQEDPAAKAAKLVELLSESLAGELQKKSIPAERLLPGQIVPDKGWLIKGQFLEVDQGNCMRRAMIGFGAGSTDMQVEVAVIDLGSGQKEPFLVFGTDSKSGKGPGAVITKNPYVLAAKFVLSKKASEKDVRKTARQIAGVLVKYMEDSKVSSN